MPNPFAVNQAGMGSGLLGLSQNFANRNYARRDRREAQERQDTLMAGDRARQDTLRSEDFARVDSQKRERAAMEQAKMNKTRALFGEAAELFESGDTDGLAQFMVKNPEVQKAVVGASGYKSEVTQRNAVESAFNMLMGNGKPGSVMSKRVNLIESEGGDATESKEYMGLSKDDRTRSAEGVLALHAPELLEEVRKSRGPQKGPDKPFAQGSGDMSGYTFNPNTGEYTMSPEVFGQLESKATKERDAALAKDRYVDAKVRKSINTDVTSLTNDSKMISQAYTDLSKLKESSSPTDQLAAVFKLMKALDPESVVREGEQAQARSTGGPADSLVGLYNKLWGGGSLPPNAFTDMVNTSRLLADSQNTATTKVVSSYLDTYEETLPPSLIKKLKARVPFLEPLDAAEEVGAVISEIPIAGTPEYDKYTDDLVNKYGG
jgi:hypothetical protein